MMWRKEKPCALLERMLIDSVTMKKNIQVLEKTKNRAII